VAIDTVGIASGHQHNGAKCQISTSLCYISGAFFVLSQNGNDGRKVSLDSRVVNMANEARNSVLDVAAGANLKYGSLYRMK
jgi:hypothetical protein